jgi:tRNA-specific 2-thiouridylase
MESRKEQTKTVGSRRRRKAVVAMSGGVDSSVAAALLKKAGFEVIGVFVKFWKEPGRGKENRCCSAEAQKDARRVASKLKIPFYTINAEKEFKKRVVDYFLREYRAGQTPNPCVECNRWIKFGLLMEKVLAFGADFLATGHYIRLRREIPNLKSQAPKYRLLAAKDKSKDQSYFLWALTQEKLKKILFPIGDYLKSEVRQMAKKFGLPVFEKKDSQEVCFINTDLYAFLNAHIRANGGIIEDINAKKIGKHEGLPFYTIGQRRGLKIGGSGPYYVVKKDFKKNILIVGKEDDLKSKLFQKETIVRKVNWISGKEPKFPFCCKVKIRYLSPMSPAKIFKIQNSKYKILFSAPQRAITPGQSAVFYKGGELLGGGVIGY